MTDWLIAVAERNVRVSGSGTPHTYEYVALATGERDRLVKLARLAIRMAEDAVNDYDGAPRNPGENGKTTAPVCIHDAYDLLRIAGVEPW